MYKLFGFSNIAYGRENLQVVLAAYYRKITMKAFISVDMELMPYIVALGHLNLKGTLYSEQES